MKEKSKSQVSIIGGADAHTLDELVQYAMNTYNLIEKRKDIGKITGLIWELFFVSISSCQALT